MTVIKIKRKAGKIVAVDCEGHSGYGVENTDILCAAISSVTQTALLGLLQVAGIPVKYKIHDKDAKLSMSLPEVLEPQDRLNADMILETMMCGLRDLYESYSDFIEIEES